VVEGISIRPAPVSPQAPPGPGPWYAMAGQQGPVWLSQKMLSQHVLFLGGIGSGKTNAMELLLRALRHNATQDDVFVIFDTKGDFYRDFYRPGDAVISASPDAVDGGVTWNVFSDLRQGDPGERADQVYEIASTVFAEDLDKAGENSFFALAARDVFAAVLEIMSNRDKPYSNADLRHELEQPAGDLYTLLAENDQAGTARYLEGERIPETILAFLQQALARSFAGAFRRPGGTFSVRDFVRRKSARALFIEYDMAVGSRLLPIYRVLLDMAIKEALSLGRRQPDPPGSVYFVMDEFALLPHLEHISDGINFGRSLGLKFLVATQNVNQVLRAYGPEVGQSILSGFGTVFAFRLMDDASRRLVRERFGANRKLITTVSAVQAAGVREIVVDGRVIEDWNLAGLGQGRCVVSFPEGPPFTFSVGRFSTAR
jgi:type IV secretory pathway TraG/TraD family ATPase VirD4